MPAPESKDWARLAEPQADGSCSRLMRAWAHQRWGQQYAPEDEPQGPRLCGGPAVTDKDIGFSSTWCRQGPVDHPNLPAVEGVLASWPEGRLAVRLLPDAFWPMVFSDAPADAKGSVSGHVVPTSSPHRGLGIYVTVNDPLGCAEGVVHEVGHLRLHCLGVGVEEHDGQLLTNPPTELYESPIRKDVERPMSAVLHALYSYVMVTQLDERYLAWWLEHWPSRRADQVLDWPMKSAAINQARIEEGVATLRRHARWTPTGQLWSAAFLDWADRVIVGVRERLADCQVELEAGAFA